MNKKLSWKILLPFGVAVWAVGKYFSDNTVGSAGALLGLIIFVMGLVDAGRAVFKRNMQDPSAKTNSTTPAP